MELGEVTAGQIMQGLQHRRKVEVVFKLQGQLFISLKERCTMIYWTFWNGHCICMENMLEGSKVHTWETSQEASAVVKMSQTVVVAVEREEMDTFRVYFGVVIDRTS